MAEKVFHTQCEFEASTRTHIRQAILHLVDERGVGKTICPSEAARAVSADGWRNLMTGVRAEAVRLAEAGEISIFRKGKPVDPQTFKGVYRLGRPRTPE